MSPMSTLIAAVLVLLAIEGLLGLLPTVAFWRDAVRRSTGQRGGQPPVPGDTWPCVALLVPCKGEEPGLADNLRALATQDYPDYSTWLITARADDPAAEVIRRVADEVPRVRWHVAGLEDRCAEKAASLRSAIEADSEAEVFVTADSDGSPDNGWLRRLVAGLPPPDDRPAAATGYRCYLPSRAGVGPWLQSVWSASALSFLTGGRPGFVWGGATAIWRRHLDATDTLERWKTTVSDDYSLTRALAAAGGAIRFVPQALVPSRAEAGFLEAFRWVTRQLLLTRVYAPRIWRPVAAHQTLWTLFVGAGILLSPGDPTIAALLVVVVLTAMLNGALRWAAVDRLLASRRREHRRAMPAFVLLAPFVAPVTAVAAVIAASSRRLRWQGTTYYLVGPEMTLILERGTTPTALPARSSTKP